jgi:hypothetical protein
VLERKRALLKSVAEKLKAVKSVSTEFDKLSAKLELAEAELEAAVKHLSQTNFGMLVEKRDSMTAELEVAEEECRIIANEKDEKWQLYQDLQEKEAELTNQREQRLAAIENAVKDAKTNATKMLKVAREVCVSFIWDVFFH